jgi:hypothetical protein
MLSIGPSLVWQEPNRTQPTASGQSWSSTARSFHARSAPVAVLGIAVRGLSPPPLMLGAWDLNETLQYYVRQRGTRCQFPNDEAVVPLLSYLLFAHRQMSSKRFRRRPSIHPHALPSLSFTPELCWIAVCWHDSTRLTISRVTGGAPVILFPSVLPRSGPNSTNFQVLHVTYSPAKLGTYHSDPNRRISRHQAERSLGEIDPALDHPTFTSQAQISLLQQSLNNRPSITTSASSIHPTHHRRLFSRPKKQGTA